MKLSTLENPAFSEKLKLLFTLGRLQLKSTSPQDIKDAESTYNQALELCKANSKLADCTAACLTLRGKARWKNEDIAGADSDFNHALEAIERIKGPERQEVLYDFLVQKVMMRIHQRRFAEAQKTMQISSKHWFAYHANRDLMEMLDASNQHLDKQGDERREVVRNLERDLQKMTPRSEDEAVQMVQISTNLGNIFANKKWRHPPYAAKDALKFSELLLNTYVKDAGKKALLQNKINELKSSIES